jgi:hypothetical protein
MTMPEIFTWEFNTLSHKWLLLSCDGTHNHNAFRGPHSVNAFMMDPFFYIAFEFEKSGNTLLALMENLRAESEDMNQAVSNLFHTLKAMKAQCAGTNSPAIEVQRPLLKSFLQKFYHMVTLSPRFFYGDNEGADGMHQAFVFLTQWVARGRIGGLCKPPDEVEPADLTAALCFFCTLMHADDNISVSLIKL